MENKVSGADTEDFSKKIEAIIRAIAVKHGIALGRNDPILILHTLNELLITELAQKQDDLIQQFHVSLEEAADHWSKNMEVKAAEILGEMRNSHSRLLNEMVENQIAGIISSISDKLNDAIELQQKRTSQHIKSLNNQLHSVKLLVYMNIAGLVMALFVGIATILIWLNPNW